ncbi:MAG TPA: oxidoreductase [Chloroflexota bacterium]|nr:oxidoreductase [Chloroflexota bacterium]
MTETTTVTTDGGGRRRPRLATVWLGGCSGCHMSFLDLDERLLDLARAADVVFSPVADAKAFPEGVDVALVEGAVANADHLALIRTVRARTRVLVSLGDCAVTGNVTALRNLVPLDRVLRTAYVGRATVASGVPGAPGAGAPDLVPPLLPRVEPLHRVVPVDAYLPGCPPSADRIWEALLALLEGRLPGGDGAAAPRFG